MFARLKSWFSSKSGKRGARCSAVVVAAGASTRMGEAGSKPFIELFGKPILAHTLDAIERAERIDSAVLVVRGEDVVKTGDLVKALGFSKVRLVVRGGDSRSESVLCGLAHLSEDETFAAVMDGARPFVAPEWIDRTVEAAFEHGGAILASVVQDTVKRCNEQGDIIQTVDRSSLFRAQTPQVFRTFDLIAALQQAKDRGLSPTDDSMAMEAMGFSVKVISGPSDNIKITTPADLAVAEAILARREGGAYAHRSWL